MPKPHHIIIGQHIDPAKLERAKQLRQEMTPAEKQLWARLRRNQLGFHFRRQQIIDGFIVDFYCHAAGLVVELDGPIHEQQRDYDQNRDEVLIRGGMKILRLTNEEVTTHFEETLDHIAKVCRECVEGFET